MGTLIAALILLQEPPVSTGYDGGFFIRGRDAGLTVGGLFQVNSSWFPRSDPHEGEFTLRRMRLEVSGDLYRRWLFHLEPKFAEDSVELEEAWIGVDLGGPRLHVGRMKEPLSLEEMGSQRHMDLLNFSILNQFVPAEDHGLTLLGEAGLLEYGLGFYNGTGGPDTNGDKDGAARLVLHPASAFQFGASATYGRQHDDVGGEDLITEARVPWAEFAPGASISGERVRLGGEAACFAGPVGVAAEWIGVRQEVNGSTAHIRGGYAQASWILTGEAKTAKGIKPERPFKEAPDLGAWQIVARWSILDPDAAFESALTNAPGRIQSITVGVNWLANEFVKVKLNLLRTSFRRAIALEGNSVDSEDSLLVQFQFSF